MMVIDTDVLIWILRGHDDYKRQFEEAVQTTRGLVFITPVQVAEITAGVRPKESDRVHEFLNALNLVNLGREEGLKAGEFMGAFGKSHSLTLADALIAAVVKNYSYCLWTLNRKHYPMLNKPDFFEAEVKK